MGQHVQFLYPQYELKKEQKQQEKGVFQDNPNSSYLGLRLSKSIGHGDGGSRFGGNGN